MRFIENRREPQFLLQKPALSRQVSESVRITTREKCKDTEILNIKGDFNRCSLPLLVIQQYDKILVQKERKKEESKEEDESFMRTSSFGEKRRGEEQGGAARTKTRQEKEEMGWQR